MQLLDFIIISENMFGPITRAAPRPANCSPISPSKLPIKTPPYLSIESFFMLQAMREAPPKMAVESPRQVGTIDGLTAAANPIRGAALSPIPNTPSPNIAWRSGVLIGRTISIFSLLFSFSFSTTQVGCIQEVATKPTMLAKAPPRDRGIIIALRAGMERTAQDVARAPPNASPVVVQTLVRNLLIPTFLEMASLVVRPDVDDISQGFQLAKKARVVGTRLLLRKGVSLGIALMIEPIILLVIIIDPLRIYSQKGYVAYILFQKNRNF